MLLYGEAFPPQSDPAIQAYLPSFLDKEPWTHSEDGFPRVPRRQPTQLSGISPDRDRREKRVRVGGGGT